jgi:hypothetical protein
MFHIRTKERMTMINDDDDDDDDDDDNCFGGQNSLWDGQNLVVCW